MRTVFALNCSLFEKLKTRRSAMLQQPCGTARRRKFRKWMTGGVAMLSLCGTKVRATQQVQNRQDAIDLLEVSLAELWGYRTEMTIDGTVYAGYSTLVAADGGEAFWGDESKSLSDTPIWDFQGSFGTPGALAAFLKGYEETGNQAYLRRAEALGDTLIRAQDEFGGWFYDAVLVNGDLEHVGIWGPWGDRIHPDENLQGWSSLDDKVSQSCAHALLRLYQASGNTDYLDAAIRFGDALIALQNERVAGIYPYRDGGFPQGFPASRVHDVSYNQNLDPRNPDAPYMIHKTLNDDTMSDAIVFLIALFEETNDLRYRNAVRLNIDYLIDMFYANGAHGWSQQYHFRDDVPAWGRAKEPPAYTTTEHHIVEALLLWRSVEVDAVRRAAIENVIEDYLDWLATVERPVDQPDYVWRYYNSDGSASQIDEVVFANDYQRYFGPQNENMAAGGQLYAGRWDDAWNSRLRDANGAFDADLGDNRLPRIVDQPLGMDTEVWTPTFETPTASWYRTVTLNNIARTAFEVRRTVYRLNHLANELATLGGIVTDSDGDGFDDAEEIAAQSNPYDSDSIPSELLSGDTNCDGALTVQDIGPFILALTNPGQYAAQFANCEWLAADLNQDGAVTVADISGFIALLTGA